MFKSIKLKLTLYFTLLIAIILLGTSYLLYQNAYTNNLSNIDGSLHATINDVVNDMSEDESGDIDSELEELGNEVKIGQLHVRLIRYNRRDKSMSVIAKSSVTKNDIFAHFNLDKKYLEDEILYRTFKKYRTVIKEVKRDKNSTDFIQVALKVSCKKSTFWTLVTVNTIILLFSIVGSYSLISRTLLPVDKVVKDVNKIESYDYKKRVTTKNIPHEIKELVDTFNKLLVRHEESFSKISQFSSDASHELKTPLTAIRGELEVGLRRERNSREYQDILKKSLFKIIEIQELIDGLLFLAQRDKLKIKSAFEELYFDEVVTECVEELRELAERKSISVKMELLPLTISGYGQLLKIACLNLLKNSILYSPNKSEINIWMERDNSSFYLFFEDQGIGISKEDLSYIFDRFYRVDKAHSSKNGGTGLGLSIVKMILDIHDFEILIESKENQGTLVKIEIKDS